MSFRKGDRVHLHDGTVEVLRRKNQVPRRSKGQEGAFIRGFVRGELVDTVTGEKQTGDWHENTITTWGHGLIVKNFVGIIQNATSNVNNSAATVQSDLGLARYWGLGYWTAAASAASDLSTASAIVGSEWALNSNSAAGSGARNTVSLGSQVLAGTWSLSQSLAYASSQISNAVTVNAIVQHSNSSVGVGTALSIALFNSSTKGTTQALNITYSWTFGT